MTVRNIISNTRRPDIAFFSSGKIDITSRIVKDLELNDGDAINIMAVGGEYYLYVASRSSTAGRHEARCYPSKRGSRHFRAYCRRLCDAILDLTGFTPCASFAAGEVTRINGRKAIPIITRKNLKIIS